MKVLLAISCWLGLFLTGPVRAQDPSPDKSPLPAVPTTRVLAIGRLSPGAARERVPPLMPAEVGATLDLSLRGKIDQWYVRQDQPGVVFLLNTGSVSEAHELLEALPLGRARLMDFELIPLGPLSPLKVLAGAPGSPAGPGR